MRSEVFRGAARALWFALVSHYFFADLVASRVGASFSLDDIRYARLLVTRCHHNSIRYIVPNSVSDPLDVLGDTRVVFC